MRKCFCVKTKQFAIKYRIDFYCRVSSERSHLRADSSKYRPVHVHRVYIAISCLRSWASITAAGIIEQQDYAKWFLIHCRPLRTPWTSINANERRQKRRQQKLRRRPLLGNNVIGRVFVAEDGLADEREEAKRTIKRERERGRESAREKSAATVMNICRSF